MGSIAQWAFSFGLLIGWPDVERYLVEVFFGSDKRRGYFWLVRGQMFDLQGCRQEEMD